MKTINRNIPINRVLCSNLGIIEKILDDIIVSYGPEKVGYNEMVKFQNNNTGVVFSIDFDLVYIIILGSTTNIKSGDFVYRMYKYFSINVNFKIMGRIINSIGHFIDNKSFKIFKNFLNIPVDNSNIEIMHRKPIHTPMYTGIKVIDNLFPIGRGQRELIVGDRKTGKTTICLDILINQKRINLPFHCNYNKMYCIYISIGQKQSSNIRLIKKIILHDCLKHTLILIASCSDTASMQFYAPYVGCTLGGYFRDRAMHAIVFYDDLTKHAISYRHISLMLKRPPGREAYPGDIFYSHSRLLERSCQMSTITGSGSLTSFPIIETQNGDLSSYIPTNVISITDGQIFLEAEIFLRGIKPAVNTGLSVSRIGSSAQTRIIKKISSTLRIFVSHYKDLQSFTRFNSNLGSNICDTIDKGGKVTEILKQDEFCPLCIEYQVILIFLTTGHLLNVLRLDIVSSFEIYIVEKTVIENRHLLNVILSSNLTFSKVKLYLDSYIKFFVDQFNK